ncbi:MAG: RluA family pseudouridine synthase [Patescibacteria group bacterium]|nr:RluA family pseudouridine synthase [Patescibacteria group bacterium]MDE2438393.1 RluA family pseudouridine synthase [Patescibacteria group bacterium]
MKPSAPTLVYEDDDMLIVNKPFGLLIHQSPHSHESTLVDWLLSIHPSIRSVGEDPDRPGIVHRLDRDTGGLVVIAKNQHAFEYLKRLFATRQITKHYLALVFGNIKQDYGSINKPIGLARGVAKRTTHTQKKTREAITEYRVRARYSHANMTLVELSPKTGRTHQLRVHMAAIGTPIVGDRLYGRTHAMLPFPLSHQFLFACSIDIPKKNGEVLHVEIPLPNELKMILESLS